MANTITPVDVYALVNATTKEMGGANASLTAMNTSTFVTVGATLLGQPQGFENTLSALTRVFTRTFIDSRRYKGKLQIIAKIPEEYGAIARKISFFTTDLTQAQDWNTDIAPNNLKDGNTIDMYKIKKQYPLELDFGGTQIREMEYTTFKYQLRQAFTNESEFAKFYAGQMTRIANDLERAREAENRLHMLNMIGAIYNTGLPGQKVNLVKAFNDEYGTEYTTSDLLSTYLTEFTAFFVERLKNDMDMLTEENELYHLTPTAKDDNNNPLRLLRFSSHDKQRLVMNKRTWRKVETHVYPEIFHDGYLQPIQYEGVMYWQNPNEPYGVKVTPNQFNKTTNLSQTGNAVTIPYVVGVLFDEEALVTAVRLTETATTPYNIKGGYYNTINKVALDHRFDATQNMILYYMEDEQS